MENASKALIIAGSIIIAIVLITLGVFIIGKARGAFGDVGLDKEQVQSFNDEFAQYTGTVKGSTVRTLIQKVVANNGTEADNGTNYQIKITGSATVNGTSASGLSGIKNTKTYTVDVTKYENKGGRISEISITE